MILEEKAEEYLQSIEGDDCVIITDREERKQAYIAGAKELEKENKTLEGCLLAEQEHTLMLEQQIEKMSELINRYYEVCVQIPKELRTMVFDSCLEDTQKMVKDKEIKEYGI